jgi:hypothetical protein
MATLWLSFCDPSKRNRFVGVAIIDIENIRVGDEMTSLEWRRIAQELRKRRIAPGLSWVKGAVLRLLEATGIYVIPDPLYRWIFARKRLSFLIQDVTDNPRILPEHKNKLLVDDDLLISLGSRGRVKSR